MPRISRYRQHDRIAPFALNSVVLAAGLAATSAWAGGEQVLQEVVIKGQAATQIGVADAASVGTVTQKQIEERTVYRPGELLEATPGLIVSQHSGEGKANQFYLRGFNLDHGTDLRTTVDGMLVNQRSHAHGQGWTDLNFIIPELSTGLEYKKGPYFASEGDFASAGAVRLKYADTLPKGIVNLGVGEDGYRRALVAASRPQGNGHLLYAVELMHNDGPFVHPDDYRKVNGVLRYSQGDAASGFNITAMGYDGKWNATDQIPQSAVDAGLLPSRLDAMDPSDGGSANRYSLSGAWRDIDEAGATEVNAYVVSTELRLYSNFTYFLDDTVNGDQFAQPDNRVTSAVNASRKWNVTLGGREGETTVGLQFQNDNARNALQHTKDRQVLSVTRADHLVETSLAAYLENLTRWTDKFRTVVGLRGDTYRFKVDADLAANSGEKTDSIVTPKLSMAFGPWHQTEYYVNLGQGFHSNDARGTTITVDPKNPSTPVPPVPGLVRSKGYELGARTTLIPGLQSALSIYQLDFASELVFLGDAGLTEAGRPSRRTGFEFSNYYQHGDWLTVDFDLAFARARFKDDAPEGRHIPGAVEGVASFALTVDNQGPWYGSLQWRYFGPRPLTEDNSVRSKSTSTFNGHVGYKISKDLKLELEGYNLTDRKASSIDYYYESRVTPGGTPASQIHFHPLEPRSFRVALVANF